MLACLISDSPPTSAATTTFVKENQIAIILIFMAARGIFILFITIVFFLDKDAFLLYGAKHGEFKFQPFRQFSLIFRKFENNYCF